MKRAYLLMHTAILLWGLTGIFGKLIQLPEGLIVWFRMFISAAGLLPLLIYNKSKRPSAKDMLRITGVGALVALHWVLFYASIKASNVSIALSCFSTVALFTAILDPVMNKRKPQTPELLLSVCVIAGLYCIFLVRQSFVTGILLALASAMLGAIFTIFNKRLTARFEAPVITFYELSTGFLVLSLFLPFYFRLTHTSFHWPTLADLGWLLLLGLLCTSVAFTISLKALEKLDAFTMNLSVNLEPIYSIFLAWIFFGEQEIKSPGFILGTVIILLSLVIHTRYKWVQNHIEHTTKIDNF